MKYFYISLINLIFFMSCQNEKKQSDIELFSSNIIESLREHDLKKFKDNSITFDIYQSINADITKTELNEHLSDLFIEFQNELNSKNIDLKDYEIFEVREPYREYESDGLQIVRYYVILKSEKGKYLKFDFIDCLKTENGYLFADNLNIIIE